MTKCSYKSVSISHRVGAKLTCLASPHQDDFSRLLNNILAPVKCKTLDNVVYVPTKLIISFMVLHENGIGTDIFDRRGVGGAYWECVRPWIKRLGGSNPTGAELCP